MVIIQDADKFVSNYRKQLERYVENPSTSGVLIFICKSWPANTRLAKLLNKVGSAIQPNAPRGRALVKWLTNQAGQYDKTMQLDTAAMLIDTIGTDLGRLAGEVEKLAMFCADRREIRSQDVEALCGITAQQSVFEINDLLAEGKLAQALGVLDRLLQQDRSAEFTLVGAVSWSLRRLLQARTMLDSGQSRQEILQAAKVDDPAMAEKFRRQGQGLSGQKLTRLLRQLAETDLANKTGLGNVQVNLEKFIVESSI